ncbi:hypothetical protein DFQ26_008488, partial [Actinomortierella ambigua]
MPEGNPLSLCSQSAQDPTPPLPPQRYYRGSRQPRDPDYQCRWLLNLDAITMSYVDFEATSVLIQENPSLQRVNARGSGRSNYKT